MMKSSKLRDVRDATPTEFDRLVDIERQADTMFEEIGIGPFADDDLAGQLRRSAVTLVVGQPPVGFATVDIVDGQAHLWQLAVLPNFGRRGIGSALVEAVCEWARSHGYPSVTLTTYRDVPWNGPFYERLGFEALSETSPGLTAIREHERAIGDDAFGPRIAMRRSV